MFMRLAPVLLMALLAVPAAAQGTLDGRRCATPEPSNSEMIEAMRVVEGAKLRARTADLTMGMARRIEPVTVPVAVHVVTGEAGEGDIPDERIEAQMDTLNAAFARFGYRFALALVERVERPEWYDGLRIDSAEEAAMKDSLARDPSRFLNLYTASLAFDYLGWAYLPDAGSETFRGGGVVLLDEALPGGSAAPYNLGHTGTHEVGHWAGLLHTFQGGCSAPNDGVDDTPQERSGASGCPPARDSCPLDPGLDPVRNYMDYSDDACMTGFTEGQGVRADALMNQYRSTITTGGFAVATLPLDGVDGVLDGERSAVTLRVANATGSSVRVVRVRVDGADLVPAGPLPGVPLGSAAAILLQPGTADPGPLPQGAFTVVARDPARPDVEVEVALQSVLPPSLRVASGVSAVETIQGEAATASVTLSNDGPGTLLYSVDTASLPDFVVSVDPSDGEVAPGQSVEIELGITTGDLDPDDYTGTIAIETNDPDALVVSLDVPLSVIRRPTRLVVGPIYPNPGRGDITIPIELPGDTDDVQISVFDTQGREIAVLGDGISLPLGYPEATWDASAIPAGLYLIRVTTPTASQTARAVVLQ